MAAVVNLESPQNVLDFLNSIAIPFAYEVLDRGSRYTIVDDLGSGVFSVETFFDEAALEVALNAALKIDAIIPKREGGKFTFVSAEDVIPDANAFQMEITKSAQELEDFLNTAITVEKIIEHDTKKLVIYT